MLIKSRETQYVETATLTGRNGSLKFKEDRGTEAERNMSWLKVLGLAGLKRALFQIEVEPNVL